MAATNPYYRQAAYVPPPPRPVADVRDDYERTFNNLHSNENFQLITHRMVYGNSS